MLHFSWIYFYFSACTFLGGSAKTIEIVRRGPNDERECDSRLMDTQAKLPDTAFTASSVRQNLPEFRPYHARLASLYAGKDHTSGRAWCPNSTVQTAMEEWIQVDFPFLNIIRTIFTTGRGDGNVPEYMPYFILHYKREDNGPWYEHTTRDSKRVIPGNIDPRNTARHTFDPTVIARRIRIYPYSAKSQHPVCLRFALKGCPFPDGITEYSATEGNRGHLGADRHRHMDFRDLTNDANKALDVRGRPGGLGKLVDNVAFLGNVTQDFHESPINHHFIGWERSRSSPVRLNFKFDQLRNFTRLLIFTFESSRLRVGLFNYTTIEFIRGGAVSTAEVSRLTISLGSNTVDLEQRSDASWRGAANIRSSSSAAVFRNPNWDGAVIVSIPLQGHIARGITMDLFHSDDWLLISEVQFISEPHVMALPSQREDGGESEVPFPGNLVADADFNPFLFGGATTPLTLTTTTASAAADANAFHEDGVGDADGVPGSMSSATVTHRQGLAKDQLRANSRGVTFVIVIVVSLLLSVFCVVLVFSLCIRMQHSRQRHQSLKKVASAPSSQMASPPPSLPPLASQQDGATSAVLASSFQTPAAGVSVCNNLTSSGTCSAAPAAYLFSPAHSTGTGAMYAAGGPPLQVLSSPAMFSPPDGCPAGLPSPGHNFASLAGGDLAAMQHLALQQQQQFYPPIGMIHPATGGDTTTDSGSLYTTPPALCPVLGSHTALRRHDDCSAPLATPSASSGDEAADTEADDREEDDEDMGMREKGKTRGRGMQPITSTERSSVGASSASEGAQHTSVSTAGGGAIGGAAEDPIAAGAVGDAERCETSALLRPGVTSTNGRRKRPKHRRQRGVNASSQRKEGVGGLHDSAQSRTDSGVGSSRAAAMAENLQSSTFSGARTMLQPFAAQPFPNLAGSDVLGTEYASTSLFSSSTASNNGLSTMKKGSSSLIGANGGGPQYPSPFLTAAAHFSDQSGTQTSATAGSGGGGNTSSYHLYQPILVPAQQAHLFQNAVAAAAAAAAAGFGDSQQLGGLVQPSPFLSQGLLHSSVPPTTAYPSETPLVVSTSASTGGGACWPVQQTSATGLKSSSGTPLPPVPTLPLPPNPQLNHHNHSHHHSAANDGTSSGRLSIYSVCM